MPEGTHPPLIVELGCWIEIKRRRNVLEALPAQVALVHRPTDASVAHEVRPTCGAAGVEELLAAWLRCCASDSPLRGREKGCNTFARPHGLHGAPRSALPRVDPSCANLESRERRQSRELARVAGRSSCKHAFQ